MEWGGVGWLGGCVVWRDGVGRVAGQAPGEGGGEFAAKTSLD